jgi:hypothetical protein
MDDGTSEPRRCEVCGDPIRKNNTYGICTDQAKSRCVAARRRKRLGLPEPGEKTCEVCGRPLRCDNKTGLCSDRSATECWRVRQRMGRGAADPRGYRHLIVIRPGDTFGLWTALEEYSPKRKLVLCRCECGTERPVRGAHLANGESGSCGADLHRARRRNGPYLAAGDTFNRLTALEDAAMCDDRIRFSCECGGETAVKAAQVKLGYTKSCNCLNATLGGFSKHPLHQLRASMIQRCTNPNHRGYGSYGGRADAEITVCERWRTDPWAFAEDIYREIGPRPEGKSEKGRALYELDRVNNNRGYWCGRCAYCSSRGQFTINVQWSDKKTQRANQRTIEGLSRELAAARSGQGGAVQPKRAAARRMPAPELTMIPLF